MCKETQTHDAEEALEEGQQLPFHRHEHTHTKEVLNRLAKAIGHLQAVKNMVERGEDCSQLVAVRSALGSTGKIILKDHIEHCLVDAIETGDKETVQQLNRAIDQFIK